MRNLSKDFENKNIEYGLLLKYGFIQKNHHYTFETLIGDDNFKLIVEISKESQISKVIDLSFNEEYVLADVQGLLGKFSGDIKAEYKYILNDIIKKCTIPNVFKSTQAEKVIRYVKEKYGDDLEYLWKKFSNNAVWRNKKNRKWYGILLMVEESKLGIESDKIVEVIDLRYQRNAIREIIDNKTIFAGYHMNKNSWITIRLDESVNLEEIYKLIDNSYFLSHQ